jgi:CDP-glucose 4,6-dehydratase
MPFNDFYQNRRVLITGHTGFKGSWLSIWLKALRAEVMGYALLPDTIPNLFTLADVASGMESRIGDVRDVERLGNAFDDFQPEMVFHLAAQPLVRRSYREPQETFDINVQGTVNVLEAIRHTPSVKVAAIVTSDKCYENREWVWGYRESDRLGGHDPYSASKAAAEMVVSSYARAYFSAAGSARIGIASLRAGNVIGGGDFAEDRIIPDAVRAAISEAPLEVRSPESRRPWQHVLEPLSGYLALGVKLFESPEAFSGAWNFGPHFSESVTVAALVDRFFELLGQGSWQTGTDQNNGLLHETTHLHLSVEKARQKLGWSALLSIDESVRCTADWYRYVMMENGEARYLCLKNIGEYVESALAAKAWWG